MAYPKLPEWPIIDPNTPPSGYLKVGSHIDKESDNVPWEFFVSGKHLIIVRKSFSKIDDSDPGEWVTEQFEYPTAGARWFVETIDRFFLHPDDPHAVPRGKFNVRDDVMGETLGVTRGAQYGSILKGIPGYSLDNLNRFRHSTLSVDDNKCQMFKMGDPWLFDDGLLDLFKDIAERHERGEF